MTTFWPLHFNTVVTLLCEMQVVEQLSLLFASAWCHSRWRRTFWAHARRCDVTRVTFRDTIVANRVCRFSVDYFRAYACAIQHEFIVVNG